MATREMLTGEESDAEEGASVSETEAPQTGVLSIEGLMPSSPRGELQREPLQPSLPFLTREELQSLFQARAKLAPVCRAVAGLEGTSQQALHRSRLVRRAFASSLAAVKRKAPCTQIKLQMVSGLGSL